MASVFQLSSLSLSQPVTAPALPFFSIFGRTPPPPPIFHISTLNSNAMIIRKADGGPRGVGNCRPSVRLYLVSFISHRDHVYSHMSPTAVQPPFSPTVFADPHEHGTDELRGRALVPRRARGRDGRPGRREQRRGGGRRRRTRSWSMTAGRRVAQVRACCVASSWTL